MSKRKYIESVFTDDRGKIYDIFVREPKDHCSLVTFNKDSVRGNHFHKKSVQCAFILDGIFKIYDTKVDGNGEFEKKNIRINKIDNLKYQWKLYRNIEKINMVKSFYYMTFYAIYGMRKFSN